MRSVIREIVSSMFNEPSWPAHAGCAMVRKIQRYNPVPSKEVIARHSLRSAETGTAALSPEPLQQFFDQPIQDAIHIQRGVELFAQMTERP